MGDQEARAAALRRQARAATRYRELSDKIRLAEARLVYARWAEADRAASAAGERSARRRGRRGAAPAGHARRAKASGACRRACSPRGATRRWSRATRAAPSRTSWRPRAPSATRRCGGWPSSTGSTLSARRRYRARGGARRGCAAAVAALEAERQAIEARLADAEAIAARIAADLTAAEAASREAEAALAGLLASEAAMRAERRVADAAIEAARNRRHGSRPSRAG